MVGLCQKRKPQHPRHVKVSPLGQMNVTRERISRILELREILLSFKTVFNLVNTAVVCGIVKSI